MKQSFPMKTIKRLDRAIERGSGDRVLLEDALMCMTDAEAEIKMLKAKLRRFQEKGASKRRSFQPDE